ncbi:UDP-N-acetylglucosamine 2-epimerase (non-hydrolyzing) [Pullulanibacillus sp. KACC 23026]|uniref:non-hydrolyzing UDP-N-acetylglucosamine 2-epimerase n=1 Tax=Pullulanibacillus sp. KACC 23026 TaxID=3028315 RepID=UPI0023AFE2DB|nr:UDP-N-acetylglucosamine 2-epimerase (non-hydrolyzing) [Pullulanibacillus sp. KACC 23026]WEG13209.1 UDP-N-acetylglucosamine 2-epimerase (non-hydrolyzing) [Pullulanibacillus sp. KACC 23026]
MIEAHKCKKVMAVFGTRPEAVKMGPVVLELQKQEDMETIVAVTAQHRELLDQVLDAFHIKPDFDLKIMKQNQTLSEITTRALLGLEAIMKEVKPDLVLVHGDTTTTFVAGLAAFYQQIPVGHVEAGLRTYNKYSPYPEEMNRLLTGVLADLHFAPTEMAAEHLQKENKRADTIFVTGNTAIDAFKYTIMEDKRHPILEKVAPDERLVLLTAHRRENWGEPMEQFFTAIRQVVDEQSDVHLIYPVHPNPKVREQAEAILGNHPRIELIQPLDLLDFHAVLPHAYLILTDSGGIQEEAPHFGIPLIVLRDTTERPEGIKAGTALLAGTDKNEVYHLTTRLLTDTEFYSKMSKAVNPYGDGNASKRIVEHIRAYFNKQ